MEDIYPDDVQVEIGKAITAREGTDAAIIACGEMVYPSLKAAELLAKDGLSVRVVDMHTIKPLDIEAVLARRRPARWSPSRNTAYTAASAARSRRSSARRAL